MTTVITRLFASEKAVAAQIKRMQFKGFPRHAMRMFTSVDAVADKLKNAGVKGSTADAYAEKLGDGAVLLINATYKPLGAARIARELLAKAETVDMGGHAEESYVKTQPEKAPSVLKEHPRFATMLQEVENRGPITGMVGMRMLSPHRTKRSAMSDGGRRMSRMFWPMPLLKEKRKANSAISGGRHMSKMFWPMPLVSTKPRRLSVIRDGDHPFSRIFGWQMIRDR
jgi:hypothetical protein